MVTLERWRPQRRGSDPNGTWRNICSLGLGLFIFGLVIGYGPWLHYMHGALEMAAMYAGSRLSQRCGQPGQQQGLRFPSLRLEQPHSIRRVLVSAFLADSIQQIHSLRARGVMSSHVSNAFASEVSAFFRSAGRSWTTPPEISFSIRASLISVSPELGFSEYCWQ